ncbi:ABC transporter permease [Candidatus Symbiobacter mobilis]|nr:ABC transporter permease [Candidatus Symbiobacter mobilis]
MDKSGASREKASAQQVAAVGRSPGRRAWERFRRHRLGYASLCIFAMLLVVCSVAELWSTDRPLLVRYQGEWFFPVFVEYSEKTFGGDFDTPADYLDPYVRSRITQGGHWALYAPNPYGARTIDVYCTQPFPAPPSARHWLGTDDRGRDLLAQLLYGLRTSVFFALALTVVGTLLGVAAGALQGFLAGKVDLLFQRFLEIWSSLPELYLLILLSAFFTPSVGLLLLLLSLFGWMGLSDYVRAEFLRQRRLDYVRAAQALGVGPWRIALRHLLPHCLSPVFAFLPYRMGAGILALTSLDFLGLGTPPGTPSLGELLAQGKSHLDAWWISLGAFAVLVLTLLLLTFVGEALRDSLDPRKAMR